MKIKVIVSVSFILLVTAGFLFFLNKHKGDQKPGKELYEENEEHEAAYQYLRWKYEADMIKDPTTGEALFGLRDQEIELAATIPQRNNSFSAARLTTQNNYIPAGPNNNGGRTRAIAYDVRYNGTTNRVLLAGGISAKLTSRLTTTLRLRHFAGAPLVEDNLHRSEGTTLVNAGAYWEAGRWNLSADLLNLFNVHDPDISYWYTSRLPGEPADGIDDRHIHPVEPRQIRVTARLNF